MEARGLYHIYREADVETIALRGAELTLEAGSWTSVMGPSGSGKSTLVYVLAGLRRADRRARWSSTARTSHGCLRPRGRAGAGSGSASCCNGTTSTRCWTSPRTSSCRCGWRGEPARRSGPAVDQLLDEVGLADRRRHRVGQLSGGEAQRAAIAVALAPQPQVLLADEPTGELDESTAAGILDLLATLRPERARAS